MQVPQDLQSHSVFKLIKLHTVIYIFTRLFLIPNMYLCNYSNIWITRHLSGTAERDELSYLTSYPK